MRYILYESQNVELDLNKIEEGYDYRSKLPNPFKTYFNETSDKIKKQAVEQILAGIMVKDKKNIINNVLNTSNSENIEEQMILSKFSKDMGKTKEKVKDHYEAFMKFFKDSCDHHNLITLDQKIDYFVQLKNNSLMNIKKDSLVQRGKKFVDFSKSSYKETKCSNRRTSEE